MSIRPTPEQVLSLAPDKAAAAAALPLAVPAAWSAAGCDDGAVWGHFVATSAEPYQVAIDLSDDVGGPAYRCNCPSRKTPCKHALGLLLFHAVGSVAPARRLPFAAQWLRGRSAQSAVDDSDDSSVSSAVATQDGDLTADAGDTPLGGGSRSPRADFGTPDPARQKRQLERTARMKAGLHELDNWLTDRVRAGLAAPELADPAIWDRLAARLVDAQCAGLANRVRRVAVKVGRQGPWHEHVLEEMALLHAIAVGAQRTSALPIDLADGVHAATGLTFAKDDVLQGVPSSGHWIVAGQSRTREDRITVQRTWFTVGPQPSIGMGGVPGEARPPTDTGSKWAMVLSFGAFGRELADEYEVGTTIEADLHWYPGGIRLRALVGRVEGPPAPCTAGPSPTTIARACADAGWAASAEPWLERFPMCILAVPAPRGNGRWSLTDGTGALAIDGGCRRIAELVAVSGGRPVVVMGEWSVDGLLPLTLFADGQVVGL